MILFTQTGVTGQTHFFSKWQNHIVSSHPPPTRLPMVPLLVVWLVVRLFRFNQPTIKINQKPFIHHSPDNKKGPYYRTFSISFSFEVLQQTERKLSFNLGVAGSCWRSAKWLFPLNGRLVETLITCASTTLNGFALRYGVMVRVTNINRMWSLCQLVFGTFSPMSSDSFAAIQSNKLLFISVSERYKAHCCQLGRLSHPDISTVPQFPHFLLYDMAW